MREREREPFQLSFCMELYQILAWTGIILLTVTVLEHKNHTDIVQKGVHWHNSADCYSITVRAQKPYWHSSKGGTFRGCHSFCSFKKYCPWAVYYSKSVYTDTLHKGASKYTGLYHITSIITSSSRTILSLAVKMILGCTLTYIYMSSTARYNYKYICDNKLDTKNKTKMK